MGGRPRESSRRTRIDDGVTRRSCHGPARPDPRVAAHPGGVRPRAARFALASVARVPDVEPRRLGGTGGARRPRTPARLPAARGELGGGLAAEPGEKARARPVGRALTSGPLRRVTAAVIDGAALVPC